MIDVSVVRGVSPIARWGGYNFFVDTRRFLAEFISRSTRINVPTVGCVIVPRSVPSMPFINLQNPGPERFGRS
jgi:hypothetical protein